MLDQAYFAKVDEFVAHYGKKPSSIIPVLEDIQEEYRYIPRDLLGYVADVLGIKESKAYSIATFYKNFSFDPKGQFVIKVCDGTACHVRHSAPILAAMQKELGLSDQKITTDDMIFTVETVSCLGACGLAPALTVNDEVYPKMTPEKSVALLQKLRGDGV